MKSLPRYPSLEFLKKEAKALRALHRQGDASCLARLRQHDTCYQHLPDIELLNVRFSINDAQRIVAREHGYSSWAALRHYIDSLNEPL